MKIYDYLIIGAGLTGLTLAQKLRSCSDSVVVLEKSRGVGGRVATRRIDDQGFDHGAQFLDDIIPGFERELIPSPRGFYLEGGMNKLMKELSRELDIRKEQRVAGLEKKDGHWSIVCESGDTYWAHQVILTAPIPQALELLKSNELIQSPHPLFEIQYTKSLMMLAVVEELPIGTYSQVWQGHSISFMDERSLHSHGVIFKLSDDFSSDYFDLSDEEIAEKILTLWKLSPLGDLKIEKYEIKKWRYSRAVNQYNQDYIEIIPGLYLAGDGFSSPLKSAQELAASL
jgi:renalase